MQLDQYLEELRPLINVDCGTKTTEGVTHVAKLMQKKYQDLGWHTELVGLGSAVGKGVFATNKPDAQQYDVLLVGHLDTVFPEGTAAERPMSLDEKNAYGPGVSDMKSGLLNIVWAIRQLEDADLNRLSIAVTMNPDEEIGSPHSHHWIGEHAKKSKCVLVAEAARLDGSLVKARKGASTYKLSFSGRASHAGNAPEQGRSTITELAHWILEINKLANPEVGTTLNVGVVKGGDAGNIVPDKAEALVDLRFRSADEYKRVNQVLTDMAKTSFTPDIGISLTQISLMPAMDPSAETEKLMALVERCGKEEGIEITWQSVGGGSDANHTAALGVPSLDGLGPIGGNFHSPQEYLVLDSIIPRIKLLKRVISSL